jgi:DNA mismatch repair ATPase MutL
MKKEIIQLSENDLHKIVKESVKNILSELDWRTYASARNKALQKSKDSDITPQERAFNKRRAMNFDDASSRAFINKHGVTKAEANNAHNIGYLDDEALRAGAELGRHHRGGDEYKNGHWRKK